MKPSGVAVVCCGKPMKQIAPITAAAPEISFALTEGDETEAVYADCNLHGLWKAKLSD